MTYSFTEKKRIRNNFGTRVSILKEPDLLSIQINSFNNFIQAGETEKKDVGLHSVFKSVFPITALNGYAEIEYVDYELKEPKYNVKECKLRGVTYAATLQVKLNLVLFDKNGSTLKKKRRVKQVIEEYVYLGQLPLMTDTGTFVINGTERVVVSQLHRSPGVIFEHDKGKTHSSGKILFSSRIIPYRGSWLDFEFDHHENLFVRIDRRRKLPVTTLLRAMGMSTNEIVDTFFAGKISPEALSALSKSFPIYFIIVATSIGVTVAGTALIGNSIGEKDKNKTLNYFTHIIFYGILVSIIITYLGLSYAEKVFYLMGSTDEVVFLGLEYTNVIYLGSVLFILVVALNSFLHAEGDTKTYRNILVLSFFLNIILNPILIFGFFFIPAMGVKGIAIATIIAQSTSLIIILIKVLKNNRVREINKNYLIPKFIFFKNIFFQSMPITVSICGYALAAAIIFTYVGQSGEYAAAGYGAGTRIEQVVLLPILGINTAIISIISQNYGAKNFNRIKETYITAIKYAFIIMVIAGIIVFISASIITSIFSNDPEVIEYGKRYLKISAFVLPAYPVFFLSNGFFMALKKSEMAMISNLFRNVLNPIVVFYIAKYIDASFSTFFWIWVGINWFFSISYFLIIIYYFKNRLDKSRAILNPSP